MDILWRKFSFPDRGRVRITLEISRDGLIRGIWIREVTGSFSFAERVVGLLEGAQPYREVMAPFNGPMTFDMVFVNE